MARIPEEIIRTVQEAVDIVEIVSRYVSLKPSGRSLKGLCPFHEEKTASFHVFPQSRRYKCFGCGESGNAFGFLMKRNNLGFREVLEELAREAHIALSDTGGGGVEDPQAGRRAAALEAIRFAEGFFRAVLRRDAGGAALTYLRGRGLEEETLETFGIGFAPDEWEGLRNYALRKGISDEALFDAGLVRRKEDGRPFDMFRGRIMFPIHDLGGKGIGFGARAMGEAQPKYLNSPDGILFHKGREVYGLHLARSHALKEGRLLLVEGYTDVMLCWQAGVRGVAAALGTSLTVENARTLRRAGVPLVLVYDGDEAGLRAAERAAETLLQEGIPGSVGILPGGRDPADLIVEGGSDALRAALSSPRDLFDYRLDRALARQDVGSLEGRRRAAGELLEILARMADPLRRDMAFKLLSERLLVPESTLRDALPRTPSSASPSRKEPPAPPGRWVKAERDFVAAALENPGFWDRLEVAYPLDRFQDPAMREIAQTIVAIREEGSLLSLHAILGRVGDEAARILVSLEPGEDAAERASESLRRIESEDAIRKAYESPSSLEAMVEAKRRARRRPEDA
ncbi:MAG: DNA primase [Planctomycetaceae bacterium]